MIDAKEARRKTMINSTLKHEMEKIEKCINEAVSKGYTSTSITICCPYEKVIEEAIITELESLGYHVTYIPEKPLPLGCPSDQWDFNAYLRIDWRGEE